MDSHLYAGYRLPTSYDSLLAKIIAWAPTREEAINRMRRALNECVITGIKTTIPFHLALLGDPVFRAGAISTGYVQQKLQQRKVRS